MTVLVIAEHDNASIKGATLNTVTAAAACGGDVHVLVAGHNAGAAAQAAAQIAGVAKVIHADAAGLAHGLAENVAAQVLAIASNYSHILFPATASGKNVAPRVAAKLDVAQISDITKVVSADTFERPIYAGNAIATVQSADAVKVITVRTTGFDAAAATGGAAAVETVAAAADTRQEQLRGQRNRQERPPRAHRRQDHRLRWPGSGQRREVQRSHHPAGRQAGRRHRRHPRSGGRGLRPQRLASGPDRQDRGACSCTSLLVSRVPSSTWPA